MLLVLLVFVYVWLIMTSAYSEIHQRIKDLTGFGPKSEEILAEVGIFTVDEFMAIDPYDLYKKILPKQGVGLNSMYAIIGARENLPWLVVARTRKTEVLMRLDDMGLAPK